MAISTRENITKTGTENFIYDQDPIGIDLLDFWKWNKSDLLEKKTRNELAKFIVARALGNQSPIKQKFPSWDLETNSGKRLAIRSEANYEQGRIKRNAQLRFNIQGNMGDRNTRGFTGYQRRWSDIYICCMLITEDTETVNPLDLNQWMFYVVPTRILDEKDQSASIIPFNVLLSLDHIACKFHNLKEVINRLS